MEITIENAFRIIIKISLRPFLASFDGISQKINTTCYQCLAEILKKPLPSTLLFTFLITILLSIMTVSIITLVAVFCFTLVVIILEGLILGVILILAAVITVIAVGIMTLLLGSNLIFEKLGEKSASFSD